MCTVIVTSKATVLGAKKSSYAWFFFVCFGTDLYRWDKPFAVISRSSDLYWRNSSSSVFRPLSPLHLRLVDKSAAVSLARRKPGVGYARRSSSPLNAVSLIYFDKKHTLMYSPKKFASCSSVFQLLQGCVSKQL
jgi:hypothetical protein